MAQRYPNDSGYLLRSIRIGGYMVRRFQWQLGRLVCLLGLAIPAAGCGGDGDSGTPPSATAIAKASAASGDGQSGTVAEPLASPLRVSVTQNGVVAGGITVNWTTAALNADLAPTSTTDAQGIATNTWTLGTVSGAQTAQASLSGATGSPVGFTATAVAGTVSRLDPAGGDEQTGTVGTELLEQVQAKVGDEFGNGVQGVDVNWAAMGGTVSAAAVTSDAAGISAVNVTLGPTPGPITITATAGSLVGSPVTFTATAVAAGPPTAAVSVVNNSFNPSSLTIAAGTTVVWIWPSTAIQHNVAPNGTQPTRSGNPRNGPFTYEFRFDTPGTYAYVCDAHAAQGMTGTIIVQ